MSNKFITIMERIGHDIKVAWNDVVKYLPAATGLAALLFPASATAAGVVNAISLIQQAVATVEQKFAAAGASTGTGSQKLSQVLAIVTPAVTQLLANEGITVDQAHVQAIVNAVVAVLNVSSAPVAS